MNTEEYKKYIDYKNEFKKTLCYYARKYHNYLEDKNFMFIIRKDKQTYKAYEIKFTAAHFLHLTGVQKNQNSLYRSSAAFYQACLKNQITSSDFHLKMDGTTQRKIEVFSKLIGLYKNINSIGEYNFSKKSLKTNIIIGDENISIGFIHPPQEYYFIPNTCLQTNIRKIAKNRSPVCAVFSKNINEPKYSHLCYLDNKIDIDNIHFDDKINRLIDSELIIDFNPNYRNKQEYRKIKKHKRKKKQRRLNTVISKAKHKNMKQTSSYKRSENKIDLTKNWEEEYIHI